MEDEFTVVIEQDEDGWFVAICPTLQGCYTEGESEEEARTLIADAIQLHLEDRSVPLSRARARGGVQRRGAGSSRKDQA